MAQWRLGNDRLKRLKQRRINVTRKTVQQRRAGRNQSDGCLVRGIVKKVCGQTDSCQLPGLGLVYGLARSISNSHRYCAS